VVFVDGRSVTFERPIARRKVKTNLASIAVKRLFGAKEEVADSHCTRYPFGRVLYLTNVKEIDVENKLCCLLMPVPLSLPGADGSLDITERSRLMLMFKSNANCNILLAGTAVVLVDVVFMLHYIINLAATIIKMMLRIVSWDVRTSSSIITKGSDGEGPEKRTPADWQKALKSSVLKIGLKLFM